MEKYLTIAAVLIAPALMAFEAGSAWNQIEGEWAVDTTDNCGHIRSIDFTFEYRRDEQGNIYYPNNQPPTRRDRLATTYSDGQSQARANVGRRVNVAEGEHALYLDLRRATLLPFNDFGGVIFEIVDNNTIRELSVDDDAAYLMRALGESPVMLVRCD